MPASVNTDGSKKRRLPKQQLAILAICRFSEPLASTSILPYLPEMIRSFKVPEEDVGKWSGFCAATFSFFQAFMGIIWGRASDRYGRKPAILLGLTVTMFTSLLWGFSTSLPMAIVARGIAGAGNGNVGIIRTTVAEMVPYKELQPQAFSLMPLVWNIGSIFGPSIGGSLANPLHIEPDQRPDHGSLFERFPYALPNIVSAAFFLIGIITGILFLRETLAIKKHDRDWGLVAGQKIVSFFKALVRRIQMKSPQSAEFERSADDETDPLLKPAPDEERGPTHQPKKTQHTRPPPWSEVLTRQAILNLIAYGFLATHTMAYDQILPVMMSQSPRPKGDLENPLKFFGGFGLDSAQIGTISTIYGVFGMVVQFVLFPPIARRLGVLYCLKWCAIVFPITYILTPFAILMPSQKSQVAVCFIIQLFKCVCAIFAFPCSTILLTNSASSLRTLGTLNGFATTVSAAGRAVGPALIGATYSFGLKKGYAITPWWLLAVFGFIGAVPVWMLVEGEGFGGDEDEEEEEGDAEVFDENERSPTDDTAPISLQVAAAEGGAQAIGVKPGPEIVPPTVQSTK